MMFIDACNAGKDTYVEKPLSLTVVKGRQMVEAAERTRRVSQVGTQRRSTASNTTGASRQKRGTGDRKSSCPAPGDPGREHLARCAQLKLGPRRAQKAPQPIPVPMGSVRALARACWSSSAPRSCSAYEPRP